MTTSERQRSATSERWPSVVTVPAGQSRMRVAMVAAAVDPAARRLGVRVIYPDGRVHGSPDPQAPLLRIHRPKDMLNRLAAGGLIGFGESYQAGEWDADDLPGLLKRIAARAEGTHGIGPPFPRRRRSWPAQARSGPAGEDHSSAPCSQLPEEFFALMLDETMTYSSAVFEQNADGAPQGGAAALAEAQRRKINRVLDLAEAGPGTRLLEIGTGWGELAVVAARRGAQVRTISDTPSQRAAVQERIARAGMASRIQFDVCRYEDVGPGPPGGYDAVVSVEMIEAVDEAQWPAFLGMLGRDLAAGGKIVLQTITMRHEHVSAARGRYTWINKYVRPSGTIPSVTAIEDAGSGNGLRVRDADAFGAHYAHTYSLWRERLADNGAAVAALGFDQIFLRTWDLYLAFRQASFSGGYLDVRHLVLERAGEPPGAGQRMRAPDHEEPTVPAAAADPDREAEDALAGRAARNDTSAGPRGVATSRWVDLGGQVHYADYGGPAGRPALVCVHGLGGSEETWALIAPALAQWRRVMALDLAGFGHSKGSGRPVSVPANEALLRQFLHEVLGEPAVLIGHSMGGTIAAMLASHHPEVAAGVVLINPAVPWVRDELDRRLAAARATLAQVFRTGRWEGPLREKAVSEDGSGPGPSTESVLTARFIEHYLDLNRARNWSRGADADFIAAARSLASALLRRREFDAMLSAISAPVLWLHGENDPAVPVDAARDAARVRPAWQFHIAPGTGHEPQRETPDWTIGVIRSWLEQIDSSRVAPGGTIQGGPVAAG